METRTVHNVDKMDQPLPTWLMLLLPLYTMVAIGLFVFPFAGDWLWLNGWLFVSSFSLSTSIAYWIINQKNPRVLRNRMKTKKSGLTNATQQAASSDRFIMPALTLTWLAALAVPSLGHRFGWPSLPLAAAIAGLVMSNAGLIVMHAAVMQNAFASKLLDINQDQHLIDTGLYGIVRHPLYAGVSIWILFAPLALGSLWGMIPSVLSVMVLAMRIRFEEDMLVSGMPGYAQYRSRVRYRLFPGIY
ncbi:MAG: isoprenylcysteine carboxylmethyltransferase family protein [Chloroflexi bacterium]|nr:isoprenylcysteine carboxylmethyltransferase family protein [Chloroflexota bacterium]